MGRQLGRLLRGRSRLGLGRDRLRWSRFGFGCGGSRLGRGLPGQRALQAKCHEDTAFATLVMDPAKSMVNCFQYINRKAQEYAEQEMKDNGIQRTGVYGLDVPDGLCFQWAEDYFNDPDAKEDHQNDGSALFMAAMRSSAACRAAFFSACLASNSALRLASAASWALRLASSSGAASFATSSFSSGGGGVWADSSGGCSGAGAGSGQVPRGRRLCHVGRGPRQVHD